MRATLNSGNINKKYDALALPGPSSGEHIRVCGYKTAVLFIHTFIPTYGMHIYPLLCAIYIYICFIFSVYSVYWRHTRYRQYTEYTENMKHIYIYIHGVPGVPSVHH